MKPVTTDIYDFAELVTDGYTYVDKTAFVHRLVAGKLGTQFFLARLDFPNREVRQSFNAALAEWTAEEAD